MPVPRVLVVDDDPGFGEFVRRVADGCGYEVALAGDAASFERNYAAFGPDLIMLDLQMPGADGIELLRTLATLDCKAPILVTEEMIKTMKPGSVIVDLAAEQGGNCELTKPGETVVEGGVKIVGPVNLPASLPYHASEMYARNLFNLLKPAIVKGAVAIDWNDEVFAGAVLTRDGQIKHEATRAAIEAGKT